MADHWIQVELDEDGDKLTVRHYASHPFRMPDGKATNEAMIFEEVTPTETDAAALTKLLRKIIDKDRERIALNAEDAAAAHRQIELKKAELAGRPKKTAGRDDTDDAHTKKK